MNMPTGPEPRPASSLRRDKEADRRADMFRDVDARHPMDDDALSRALEMAPYITVPPDFAARVMRALPRQHRHRGLRGARVLPPRYGVAAALAATVLALLLLTATPHVGGTGAALHLDTQMHLGMQLLLSVELLCGALWFGIVRWRFR